MSAAEAQLSEHRARIESMTNVELRAELKRLGCSTTGNKKDLLAKLLLALVKHSEDIEERPALEEAEPVLPDIPIPTSPALVPVEPLEEKPVREAPTPDLPTPVVLKTTLIKGFGRSTNHRLNLSSDILKTLIPNISLAPDLILDTTIDLSSESMTIGDLVDQKPAPSRRVVMDVVTTANKPTAKTNGLTTDELVRIKEASDAREPSSNILHISGLTRPFTLQQLRELLRRFGSFDDDQCWLDKIKSQSLVAYNTVEDADKARQAIDGCRWPSTNPKTLAVRYARQDEFDFSRTRDLPPDQMSLDTIDRLMQVTKPPKQKRESKEVNSGFLIIEDEPVPTENSAIKGLDDLFRKTEAKPVVYWLPLTDEQIIERAQRKREHPTRRRSVSSGEKRARH